MAVVVDVDAAMEFSDMAAETCVNDSSPPKVVADADRFFPADGRRCFIEAEVNAAAGNEKARFILLCPEVVVGDGLYLYLVVVFQWVSLIIRDAAATTILRRRLLQLLEDVAAVASTRNSLRRLLRPGGIRERGSECCG